MIKLSDKRLIALKRWRNLSTDERYITCPFEDSIKWVCGSVCAVSFRRVKVVYMKSGIRCDCPCFLYSRSYVMKKVNEVIKFNEKEVTE